MSLRNIRYAGWGVLLLGLLFGGCDDDDEKAEVMPETVLTVEAPDLVFPQDGGSKNMKISSNRAWSVVRNEGGWVEISGEALGEPGTYDVSLKAVANPGTHSRTAKFTVTAAGKAEVVEFTQFGKDPEVLPALKNLSAGCDGGEYDMTVNANVAPLTPTPSAEWLTVVPNSLQSASYLYVVKVAPNTGAKRTGTVTFTGEGAEGVVTVEQAAFEPHLVTAAGQTLPATALTTSVTLNFQVNAEWSLEWGEGEQPTWISAVAPTSGKALEEATVIFSLTQNTAAGAQVREAAFRIKYADEYADFTLRQAEPDLSVNGTRETDSLALGEFYNKLRGVKPNWDLSLPMDKWGEMKNNEGQKSYALSFDPEGRVIGLILNECTIEGELPEAIGDLHLLRKLICYGLTARDMTFPASFAKLQDLQVIDINFGLNGGTMELPDLSKNEALYALSVTGVDPKFAEPETPVIGVSGVEGITRLETLLFTDLNMGELPDLSGSPKLKSLVVRNSDITRFPAEIAGCTELRTLELQQCRLKGELPDVFTNTSLTTIDIASNQMEGELPLAMFTSQKLMSASVSNNNFTGNLPKELSTVSKLNSFACRLNRLGGDGVMLPTEILKDTRWKGMVIGGGGSGSGGWFGSLNICEQQPKYGWDNCQ